MEEEIYEELCSYKDYFGKPAPENTTSIITDVANIIEKAFGDGKLEEYRMVEHTTNYENIFWLSYMNYYIRCYVTVCINLNDTSYLPYGIQIENNGAFINEGVEYNKLADMVEKHRSTFEYIISI